MINEEHVLLTVIDVSNSQRFWEISDNMNVMHGIIYTAFYPYKDEDKLFYCDLTMKEIRILSHRKPNREHLSAQFAISPKDIHIYDYTPRLSKMDAGKVLKFTLMGNPVKSKEGKRRPITEREGCLEWFKTRAEGLGFCIREIALVYPSKPYIGKNNTILNTVLFKGVLEIKDKNLFKKTILSGIGHEKGFGFGMLWVVD